jgi:hypothetical protein
MTHDCQSPATAGEIGCRSCHQLWAELQDLRQLVDSYAQSAYSGRERGRRGGPLRPETLASKEPTVEHRKKTGVILPRGHTDKLLAAARAFDVERGGFFDAKWTIVQVWCLPGDVPSCWDAPLTPGAWGPSELVGDITWDGVAGDADELVLVIYAQQLIDFRRQRERQQAYEEAKRTGTPLRPRADVLTEADRASLCAWLEGKARELLRLADLQPAYVGTRCPFCADWTLYRGELLNGLVEHVTDAHPEQQVRSLNLGAPTTLTTAAGVFPLEEVHDFAR